MGRQQALGSHEGRATEVPNGGSCLSSPESLWDQWPTEKVLEYFAWSKINNRNEAQVCLFYALKRLGNIESAGRWFKSQGFNVRSRKPEQVQGLKTYRLDAGWLIQPNGHKFRGQSFLSRITPDLAWAMNIVAHWNPETGELLGVGLGYTFE